MWIQPVTLYQNHVRVNEIRLSKVEVLQKEGGADFNALS